MARLAFSSYTLSTLSRSFLSGSLVRSGTTDWTRSQVLPRTRPRSRWLASQSSNPKTDLQNDVPESWEDNPNFRISKFSELPHTNFGINQHMLINEEFKESLRQILWQFRAPIRYAIAYGSGIFPQGGSKVSPESTQQVRDQGKMIDFIFGVSYVEHWHSINMQQNPHHYSALRRLGSGAVAHVHRWGAGVYFNPYIEVNGALIKYGVVALDTLCQDLSQWDTLYMAGRLQKPVKILRDDPRVRLANQMNLISALRTALLLLPGHFTERDLYITIAGISYMGDPRMTLPGENRNKISNIVDNQLTNFRRLYGPLLHGLPNARFVDAKGIPYWADERSDHMIEQDTDPVKRGNIVRRLPEAFRKKLYFLYQSKYRIPHLEYEKLLEETKDEGSEAFRRKIGGEFEQRIAAEPSKDLHQEVSRAIKQTITRPSTIQTLKGILTAGFQRSYRYASEKIKKYNAASTKSNPSPEEKQVKE